MAGKQALIRARDKSSRNRFQIKTVHRRLQLPVCNRWPSKTHGSWSICSISCSRSLWIGRDSLSFGKKWLEHWFKIWIGSDTDMSSIKISCGRETPCCLPSEKVERCKHVFAWTLSYVQIIPGLIFRSTHFSLVLGFADTILWLDLFRFMASPQLIRTPRLCSQRTQLFGPPRHVPLAPRKRSGTFWFACRVLNERGEFRYRFFIFKNSWFGR